MACLLFIVSLQLTLPCLLRGVWDYNLGLVSCPVLMRFRGKDASQLRPVLAPYRHRKELAKGSLRRVEVILSYRVASASTPAAPCSVVTDTEVLQMQLTCWLVSLWRLALSLLRLPVPAEGLGEDYPAKKSCPFPCCARKSTFPSSLPHQSRSGRLFANSLL